MSAVIFTLESFFPGINGKIVNVPYYLYVTERENIQMARRRLTLRFLTDKPPLIAIYAHLESLILNGFFFYPLDLCTYCHSVHAFAYLQNMIPSQYQYMAISPRFD